MASLEEPTTWTQWGEMDPELIEILQEDSTPRFDKDNKVSSIPKVRDSWAPLYKKAAANILTGAANDVYMEEHFIPRRDESLARCLIYRPTTAPSSGSPLLVLFHGGGWCFGCPEMEATNCVNAVQAYGAIAISVEYRLAPEFPFPGAINDGWDAFTWIAENAFRLGADPSKGFVIGGTSAGGNISAALSHMARDESISPPLTGVYLNIPTVLAPDAVPEKYMSMYQSREQNKAAPVLNEAAMNMYEEAYAPERSSHLWNPFLWASGHDGLPPHYFQLCGLDPLRDEALIYERVLRMDYGVRTKVDMYSGLPHVFWANFPTHSKSKDFALDAKKGLGWLFGKEG